MQRQAQSTVVVTSGDYYIGHEIAHLLSEKCQRDRESKHRIVVTARNPDRCKDLENMGVEVKRINYEDENSLIQAFNNADWVIMCADPEQNRVQNTNRAIDALQKANVKNVMLKSLAGAEAQGRKELNEFLEIERRMQQGGRNYVILRCSWITNWFHLWGPYVMENGQFPLMQEKNQKFAPLSGVDLARVIYEILSKGIERHQQKTYTLTGPETIDGQQLVDELNHALGGDAGITYKKVGRRDVEQYLSSLRNRDDSNLQRRFPGQPTDKQIQTLVDIMEWVTTGQANFKTDDVRKITNSEGEKALKFFERNQAEFRGHGRV